MFVVQRLILIIAFIDFVFLVFAEGSLKEFIKFKQVEYENLPSELWVICVNSRKFSKFSDYS